MHDKNIIKVEGGRIKKTKKKERESTKENKGKEKRKDGNVEIRK